GIHRAPLKTWPQMLASTVQFSNNDQPPTTPPKTDEFTGAGSEGTTIRPHPQTPNNVPNTMNPIPFSTPKQYSQNRAHRAE
ncbi:hypothetical protein, partial [Streptomyces sp. NRRL F-2295]|uniref:hypothetical protein n=1 Tax=Streptomyces sp. NRRL F-2295 TaxID=1519477 RepID=UPI001F35C241